MLFLGPSRPLLSRELLPAPAIIVELLLGSYGFVQHLMGMSIFPINVDDVEFALPCPLYQDSVPHVVVFSRAFRHQDRLSH